MATRYSVLARQQNLRRFPALVFTIHNAFKCFWSIQSFWLATPGVNVLIIIMIICQWTTSSRKFIGSKLDDHFKCHCQIVPVSIGAKRTFIMIFTSITSTLLHWYFQYLQYVNVPPCARLRWYFECFRTDMIFVQNFTQPDFQAKSFTLQKCEICDIFLAN